MAHNQVQKQKRKTLLRTYLDIALSVAAVLCIVTVFAYARLSQSIFVDGSAKVVGGNNECNGKITGTFTLGNNWQMQDGSTNYISDITINNNTDEDIIWTGIIKSTPDLTIQYSNVYTYANSLGEAELKPFFWNERIPAHGSVTASPQLNVLDAPIKVSYVQINQCKIYENQDGGSDPETPEELTEIILRPTETSVIVGETASISAIKRPSGAREEISWISSNENVATVSQNGSIRGISEGDATIMAVASNGVSATATVHVMAPVDTSSVNISWETTAGWANNIQFAIRVQNTNLQEIKSLTFALGMPENSSYIHWSQGINNKGNHITVTNIPASGTLEYRGQITFPNGYIYSDYTSPTITVESIK